LLRSADDRSWPWRRGHPSRGGEKSWSTSPTWRPGLGRHERRRGAAARDAPPSWPRSGSPSEDARTARLDPAPGGQSQLNGRARGATITAMPASETRLSGSPLASPAARPDRSGEGGGLGPRRPAAPHDLRGGALPQPGGVLRARHRHLPHPGDTCTRGCRFCAVARGVPCPPADDEPERLAQAWRGSASGTWSSPRDRDGLPDGGAAHFARVCGRPRADRTVWRCHLRLRRRPGGPEVLLGRRRGLQHNVETVPRLYRRVRPGSRYRRSLAVPSGPRGSAPPRGEDRPHGGPGRDARRGRGGAPGPAEAAWSCSPSAVPLSGAKAPPGGRIRAPAQFQAYEAKAREMGFRDVFSVPTCEAPISPSGRWPASRGAAFARGALEEPTGRSRIGKAQPAP